MDLSIIIPIYNTDTKVLGRCFDSIKRITELKYECLLIDDGSKEETAQFCEKYAQQNAEFSYFRKDNGGVSSARNMGIQLSRGDYICFVDSDDEIEPSAFCKELLDTEYDLIFTDLVAINGIKQEQWKAFDDEGNVTYEKAVERMAKDGTLNGPYCKFIRRTLVIKEQIHFDEKMVIAEDAVFAMQVLLKKPKMRYIRGISYYYYHSYGNGDKRFLKHTERCVEDLAELYQKAIECITACQTKENHKEELIAKRQEMLVGGLFELAMVCAAKGLGIWMCKETVKRLLCANNKHNLRRLSWKAKIKLITLKKGYVAVLKILGCLRRKD